MARKLLKTLIKVTTTTATVAFANVALAQSNSIIAYNTTVERLLTSANFGECMFEPTIGPGEAGMNCPNKWITVDCAALLPVSTKSTSAAKWETVQLAYVSGKTIRVRVDPMVDIGGWCWLEQVQTCPDQGDCGPQPVITPE